MRHVFYFIKDILKALIIGIIFSLVLIVISGGITYLVVSFNNLKISNTITSGTSSQEVKKAQGLLKTAGYYNGNINGDYNSDTKNSVMQFQKNNNIAQTGNLDVLTAQKLTKEAHSINIFENVKKTLYYLSMLVLILSAAFFVQRDATRPLIYDEEWKKYFRKLNLGFVIMLVGLSFGIIGMVIQTIGESGWLL